MKTALGVYIAMGVLTVVPLILFNIKKVWVRQPPDPPKFKWGRGVVILLLSALIVTFLSAAYQATLNNRYEIATERLAEKHAEMVVGSASPEELRAFMQEHATEAGLAAFDATVLSDQVNVAESTRFQVSDRCIPKYWVDVEGFDQVPALDQENPIYTMYLLDIGGEHHYYAVRMVNTEDGWKYDWFGEASEQQQKVIKMPTIKNGKWFQVP